MTPLAKMSAHAQKVGITPASVHYAVWALTLSTYVGSETVVFGTVLLGRNLPIAASCFASTSRPNAWRQRVTQGYWEMMGKKLENTDITMDLKKSMDRFYISLIAQNVEQL